jgi:hypothetical protein
MRLFTTLLFATPFLLHADPNLVKEVTRAVDGVYFKAFILPVGTEDRLVVRLYEPRRMAEFSLLSQDGQNGSHIENIQWSKDGKFLIFSTSSSGGHSPWNFKTYAFSTDKDSFLSIDDTISPITSPNFTFIDTSHIEVDALKSPSSSTDDSEKRVIDLETLPWEHQRMKTN